MGEGGYLAISCFVIYNINFVFSFLLIHRYSSTGCPKHSIVFNQTTSVNLTCRQPSPNAPAQNLSPPIKVKIKK